MINEILIYYRLHTLGGNLLHKNIVTLIIYSRYRSITTQLPKQSLKPQLFKTSLKNERKTSKKQCNSGSALSLTFAYGPAPFVQDIYVLIRSVCKGEGAYPCKSQKAQFLSLKTHLGLIRVF